jgi:hypothetical protein
LRSYDADLISTVLSKLGLQSKSKSRPCSMYSFEWTSYDGRKRTACVNREFLSQSPAVQQQRLRYALAVKESGKESRKTEGKRFCSVKTSW